MEKNEPRSNIIWYFLLNFSITWGAMAPFALAYHTIWEGDISRILDYGYWLILIAPVSLMCASGPTVSALVLSWREGGGRALRELGHSFVRWRVHVGWYLLVTVVPISLTASAILLSGYGATFSSEFSIERFFVGITLHFPLYMASGPFGEELGWRGYALPRLPALNFVIDDVLEGGVNSALCQDLHGKTLSFLLLGEMTVRVPLACIPSGSRYRQGL